MIDQSDQDSRLLTFWREYRQEINFVLIFSIGLLIAFKLVYNETVAELIIKPITIAEAWVASQVLELIGYANTQIGYQINGAGGNPFRMEVRNNCNGVYESIVFLMAFIAIQIPWRRKIGWMLFGLFIFHCINELRLISLFIIGTHYSNETFVFFHETFWNYALVIFTLGIFIFCAHKVSKTPAREQAPTEAPAK
jgi:exosortase/archaeosortase family protein